MRVPHSKKGSHHGLMCPPHRLLCRRFEQPNFSSAGLEHDLDWMPCSHAKDGTAQFVLRATDQLDTACDVEHLSAMFSWSNGSTQKAFGKIGETVRASDTNLQEFHTT